MAERKGPLLRESADISRLITGHTVNNSGDNKGALHAYEVALKTTHDKCQKQAEQLRQMSDEARRQLADKAELHAEIARLRESAGRQRERASQLHRQLAASHRESSALRQQVALQQRQLSVARRRMEDAGLAPPSLEQANRGSDEMDVQLSVAAPDDLDLGARPDSPDISSMTEDEIARRLLQLQKAGHQSLQDSFDDMLSGLKQAAAVDSDSVAALVGSRAGRLSQTLRCSNETLRQSVATLQRLRRRGATIAPSADSSLPPLQEIPLTGSPPAGRRRSTVDGATDAPSGRWRDAGAEPPPTCPICGQLFRPPATRLELEDHVYAHVLDMTAEEEALSSEPPTPSSSSAAARAAV